MLFITIGIAAFAVATIAEPQCHLSQLWSCEEAALEAVESLPKRSIPHTEEEIEAMCKRANNAIDCAKKYKESCMTPMQKEFITYVVEGVLAGQEEICDPSSDVHKKYLEHASCLNEVSHMDEVKLEMEYILAVMEKAESVDPTQRIIYSCCAYAHTTEAFLQLGRDHCGQDATDTIENVISLGVAQLPEILCSGFESQDERCQNVLPPKGTKPEGEVHSPILDVLKEQFKDWLD